MYAVLLAGISIYAIKRYCHRTLPNHKIDDARQAIIGFRRLWL
jgi:hypothetical protein